MKATIISIIIIISMISVSYAATVDLNQAWHPLSEIAQGDSDLDKVDDDDDGVIDYSESLDVTSGKATIGDSSSGKAVEIDGSSAQWSAIDFLSSGTAMWGIGRNSDGDFYIDRSGIGNAFLIDRNTQNVGIGTSIPAHALDVNGDIRGDQLCIGLDCRSAWPSAPWNISGSNAYKENGNVGIGINAPLKTLDVRGGSAGSHTALFIGQSSITGLALGYDGNSPNAGSIQAVNLNFANSSRYVDLIVNYDGGNVGIGTRTPSAELDVVGNIKGDQLCIGADCRSAWPAGGTGTDIYVNSTGDTMTGRLEINNTAPLLLLTESDSSSTQQFRLLQNNEQRKRSQDIC